MNTLASIHFARPLRALALTLLGGGLLLAAGCHRAPQTAAELRAALPKQFEGEVRLQGRPDGQRIRLQPHNWTALDAHTLEFGAVHYTLLDAAGGAQDEGEADLRGTIAVPGFAVKIQSVGSAGGGEEMLRAGSFQGKLSADLQRAEATWQTSLGTGGSLKVEATH